MSVWIPAYFDLEAGIVIKGKPLGSEEGVRCCQVLVPFQRPVASAEQLAHLVIIMIIDEGGHDSDGGGDALQFPRLAHLAVIDRVAIILREYVRR